VILSPRFLALGSQPRSGSGPWIYGLAVVAMLPTLVACGDGGSGGAPPEGEVFETRGRLVAAAAGSGTVSVWDLDVDVEVTRYELAAPAVLERPLSRQITAVVASQPEADRIDVLGTGVWVWDHVDHFHVYKEPAAVQVDPDLAREGLAAQFLDATGGWVVAFDPQAGRADALFERSIGNLRTDVDRTRSPVWRTFQTEPHPGFALVARGHLIVTEAAGGLTLLPPGTTDFGPPAPMGMPCASPTAGTGVVERVVIGCGDDLLALTWDDEGEAFESARIALPADASSPAWLLAEDDLPVFVGDGGASGVLLVDPATESAQRVEVGGSVADVAADRDGQWVLVLRDDGALVLLSSDGEVLGEVALSLAGPAGRLAVGDGFAYVGDPDGQQVFEVDLVEQAVTDAFDLGFAPGDLVVTALWPGGEPVRH